MEKLYHNGEEYDIATYKVEIYNNDKLEKTEYRLFGACFPSPRSEAIAWGSNQAFWLKKVEGWENPVVKIYDENDNIIYVAESKYFI